MKKLICLMLVAVLSVALLCGCGGNSNGPAQQDASGTAVKGTLSDKDIEKSILGAWEIVDENSRVVYIFQEGGTGYAALFPMTYTVKDGVITVTVEAFGKTTTDSANYSLDGDTITLEKDGVEKVMTRTEIPEEFEEFEEKMGK